MRRVTAHLFFHACPPLLLRRMYLEYNDEGLIQSFKSLDDELFEPSRTEFLEGMIAPPPVLIGAIRDVKCFKFNEIINSRIFQLEIQKLHESELIPYGEDLIIDMQTDIPSDFIVRMQQLKILFPEFTLQHLVWRSILLPRKLAGLKCTFENGSNLGFICLKL